MVLSDPAPLQQLCGSGKLRFPMYHLMYRFVPAVSGFRWKSLDSAMVKKLNGDNHLRRSSVFSGSPWKVEVERVKGIEPSYEAWEAAVLPLNYTRFFSSVSRRHQRLARCGGNLGAHSNGCASRGWMSADGGLHRLLGAGASRGLEHTLSVLRGFSGPGQRATA